MRAQSEAARRLSLLLGIIGLLAASGLGGSTALDAWSWKEWCTNRLTENESRLQELQAEQQAATEKLQSSQPDTVARVVGPIGGEKPQIDWEQFRRAPAANPATPPAATPPQIDWEQFRVPSEEEKLIGLLSGSIEETRQEIAVLKERASEANSQFVNACLLIPVFGAVGFFLPWGTVRVLGWVIQGFLIDWMGRGSSRR
jgi:hypothetical protein